MNEPKKGYPGGVFPLNGFCLRCDISGYKSWSVPLKSSVTIVFRSALSKLQDNRFCCDHVPKPFQKATGAVKVVEKVD